MAYQSWSNSGDNRRCTLESSHGADARKRRCRRSWCSCAPAGSGTKLVVSRVTRRARSGTGSSGLAAPGGGGRRCRCRRRRCGRRVPDPTTCQPRDQQPPPYLQRRKPATSSPLEDDEPPPTDSYTETPHGETLLHELASGTGAEYQRDEEEPERTLFLNAVAATLPPETKP